jgi:TatD DNase family protein
MELTDTHCHLDEQKFDFDREAVLERAIQAGVGRILIPGLSLASSRSAVKLAKSHPVLYAAIGVHPTEAGTWSDRSVSELLNLSLESGGLPQAKHKIVAIGEIGLDYYWDTATHELQQKILKEQLALAAELHLPVVIHFREKGDAVDGPCSADLLKILDGWVSDLRKEKNSLADHPGVLHSFSGSRPTAESAISFQFYIGVTGPVTYRKERQDLIATLPLERLLIETDAPFLSPNPNRGKRNEPAYVRLIADKIAAVHAYTTDHVAAVTSENAQRLFAWK